MKTSRAGRRTAGWTLVLASAVLVGLGTTVRADASAQKAEGTLNLQTATVKLDSAMLQERTVGADGTVRTQTYLDAMPIQAAKATPLVASKPQAISKA